MSKFKENNDQNSEKRIDKHALAFGLISAF